MTDEQRQIIKDKATLVLKAEARKPGVLYAFNPQEKVAANHPKFTVDRNAAKSEIDSEGYIKFVDPNVSVFTWENGKYVISLDPTSTNKYLYPFSAENSYSTKTGLSVELDASTAGTELVTNGDMELDSDWGTFGTPDINEQSTTQVHSGTYSRHVVVSDASYSGITQTILTVANKSYLIDTWVYIVSGQIRVELGNGAAKILSTTGQWVNVKYYDYEPIDNDAVIIRSAGVNAEFYVDDVSIKEVSGFASPFKDNSGNVILAARKLVEDTSTGAHMLDKLFTVNSTNISFSVIEKNIDDSNNRMGLNVYVNDGVDLKQIIYSFDPTTETFTEIYNGGSLSATVTTSYEKLANGYYKLIGSVISGTTITTVKIQQYLVNGSSYSYTGDGTSGIYISGIQFEEQPAATSFINNPLDAEGSETTRVVDGVNLPYSEKVTEFTINIKSAALDNVGNKGIYIFFDDGSYIIVRYSNSNIECFIWDATNSTLHGQIVLSTDVTKEHDICYIGSQSEVSLIVDGTVVSTIADDLLFLNTINTTQINLSYSTFVFSANMNKLLFFNKAISVSEAIELTK